MRSSSSYPGKPIKQSSMMKQQLEQHGYIPRSMQNNTQFPLTWEENNQGSKIPFKPHTKFPLRFQEEAHTTPLQVRTQFPLTWEENPNKKVFQGYSAPEKHHTKYPLTWNDPFEEMQYRYEEDLQYQENLKQQIENASFVQENIFSKLPQFLQKIKQEELNGRISIPIKQQIKKEQILGQSNAGFGGAVPLGGPVESLLDLLELLYRIQQILYYFGYQRAVATGIILIEGDVVALIDPKNSEIIANFSAERIEAKNPGDLAKLEAAASSLTPLTLVYTYNRELDINELEEIK